LLDGTRVLAEFKRSAAILHDLTLLRSGEQLMRDFFINSFEKLVSIIIVVMGIGIVVVALGIMSSGQEMGPGGPGGVLAGLLMLIGGSIYLIFIGGIMYLGLGIYQNTKRTADAVEKLLGK
jgi:hypothetical protein